MKFWFPLVAVGTGSDHFTWSLSQAMQDLGHSTEVSVYSRYFEFLPQLLATKTPSVAPEIIITNSWNGFAFRNRAGKLIVVVHLWVHDPAYSPWRNFAQAFYHRLRIRGFEKRSLTAADAVVCVSEYTARAVKSTYPSVNPVVITNGVDTDFFTPPASRSITQPAFTLLFAGTPSQRKGYDLLPPILEELGENFAIQYTTKGFQPKVKHPRLMPVAPNDRGEMRKLYQQADLLIFPTRLEGFGLVVAEGLACGLPAIVSDNSSMPELVENDENGYLCEPNNPIAFAAAVRSALESPDQYQRLCENARITATTNFGLAKMAEKYIQLANDLLI